MTGPVPGLRVLSAWLSRLDRGVLIRAAGVLCVLLSLVLPWDTVRLQPRSTVWDLAVLAPRLPRIPGLTYGALITAAAVVAFAITAFQRRSWLPVALAGVLVVLVTLYFPINAAGTDYRFTTALSQRSSEYALVASNFGFHVPSSRLSAVLVVALPGPWRNVVGSLQPGWLLGLAGGSILLVTSARQVWSCRRSRLTLLALGAVAGAILLVTVARGYVADQMAKSAFEAGQLGNYRLELHRFHEAESLNPTLALRQDIQQEVGTAYTVLGQTDAPDALYASANDNKSIGNLDLALRELATAHALAPTNPVIEVDYLSTAISQAVRSHRVTVLFPLLNGSTVDQLPARFAVGRIMYENYDDTGCIAAFGWVISHTGDRDVRSSALTYISLSEQRLGRYIQAREDLVKAIAIDKGYDNTVARDLATGLISNQKR